MKNGYSLNVLRRFIRTFSKNGINNTGASTLGDRLKTIKASFEPPINIDTEEIPAINNNNILREYLYGKNFYQFLEAFYSQTNMDFSAARELLDRGLLTNNDISVFINKLLPNTYATKELATIMPRADLMKLEKTLYHIYRVFLLPKNQILSPMQLYDLNKFIKIFLYENDLSQARDVFRLILRNYDNELPRDTQTVISFLQLYFGSMTRYWDLPHMNKNCNVWIDSTRHGDFKMNYQLLSTEQLYDLINKLNKNKSWFAIRNCELESAIIYSLGYLGQIKFMGEYIEKYWGINLLGKMNSEFMVSPNIYPDSQLLTSIITSYAYCGKVDIAIKILGGFLNKYPNMDMEIMFWRRLIHWSHLTCDLKLDKRGKLQSECWEIMRQWHKRRGKTIPPDKRLLDDRLTILKKTRDYKEALKVFEESLGHLFIRKNLTDLDKAIIFKYQKFILKTMCALGHNKKCIDFICQWSLDWNHQQELQTYFKEQRCKLENKRVKQLEVNIQQGFNDDDDDFTITGSKLW